MQRIGKGFVFASALIWIVAGSIVFSSKLSGDPPRVALQTGRPTAVASAATGYDTVLSDETISNSPVHDASDQGDWEGPYYVSQKTSDTSDTDMIPELVMADMQPWYVRLFGGFGSLFARL